MIRCYRQRIGFFVVGFVGILILVSHIYKYCNGIWIESYLENRAKVTKAWYEEIRSKRHIPWSSDAFAERLSKFNRSSGFCEDLVGNWSLYNMSSEYYRLLPQFQTRLLDVGPIDRASLPGLEVMSVLHYLAAVKSVRTVCETGFRYGHTSFNFVTANPNISVYSFHSGNRKDGESSMSSELMAFFTDQFGRIRLNVFHGDPSTEKMFGPFSPQKLPLCDIIFVSEGRGYQPTKADIDILAAHSSKGNLIIIDNYPSFEGFDSGRAWEEKLIDGSTLDEVLNSRAEVDIQEADTTRVYIFEELRCRKRPSESGTDGGFAIGRVV